MSVRAFGTLWDGRAVEEVTISNDRMTATFLTHGARINGLSFDGVSGLTHECSLAELETNPFAGVVVGPVMNRIAKARAPLDGGVLEFVANEGPNFLHSGDLGLHRMVWDIVEASEAAVTFAVDLPPDAFPGHRRIAVTYRLDGADLVLEVEGTTDAPTLMNVGWHPFWTLSGQGRDGHTLEIHPVHYLPMDDGNIPTGAVEHVEGTSLDYRAPRAPGDDIDHCFVLAEASGIQPMITIQSKDLMLQILSDAPAVHVFTGMPVGIAVEPEIHPDAPNHAHFPSIRLDPSHTFRQTSVHRFSRC